MSKDLRNKLIGTGVALITPFKEDGSIDFDSLGRVIDHCIDGGVEYLVSLGSTGEAATLNESERKEILTFSIDRIAGRVPLVAGFGGNDTKAMIDSINAQDFTGIDAILSSSPHYNKPSQTGIVSHYRELAEASPVPIIIYNVPGRTSSNINSSTSIELARSSDKFIAIKEASGDIVQGMEIIAGNTDMLVLSGEDMLVLPMLATGFKGVISVIANIAPKQFSEMTRAGLNGDFEKAAKLHYNIMPLIDAIFQDGNPGGVKAALSMMGLCENNLRLPLVPVNNLVHTNIEKALEAL